MTTGTSDEQSNEIAYYHSFVPQKYRLLTLIGFVRAHLNSNIVIACCSTGVAEYNKILFNFLELRCDAVHGKQDQQHRESSIRRFKSGEVSVLFATSLLLSTIDIKRPTWLIHYDIPKEIPDEIKIIKNILIFLKKPKLLQKKCHFQKKRYQILKTK